MEYRFNKYQTQVTPELFKELHKEVKSDLIDILEHVAFINNMASPDRLYANQLDKDEEGKIIVDITNPHILEDMDYFRPSALYYQKHGVYTHFFPSKAPNGPYKKFWSEEARRCREGYVRESDGEWVSGYYYFYLNYSPIQKVLTKEGSKRADRITDFPNVYDGDYLFFHYLEKARNNGNHTATLKKRGSGFSFKGGSKLARNFITGESIEATKNVKSYAIADEKEFLTKDGVLNKFIDIADFLAEATPFPSYRGLKNSWQEMHWKLGYVDKVLQIEKGVKNEVFGVTLKNEPEKARGKRGALIEWEEAGKFKSFLRAWQIARPSVEEDGFAFGLMNAYGTGGTEGADFFGLQEIFYNPIGYNILGLPNVYDKNVSQGNLCSFFFGTYMNANGYYDENGNSDVIGAIIYRLKEKVKIKYGTSDPNAVVQYMAENPITPQDAIMRTEGGRFPISELKNHLSEIMPNLESFTSSHFIGELKIDSKGDLDLDMMGDYSPVRKFPLTDNKNKEGCLEIFEKPIARKDGTIPRGRYIAGCDPYDDDESTTNSLGSLFVMDVVTDRIVAEYTGRPRTAKEFFKNVLNILKYYNAICNYENDKKGLYAYCENNNSVNYLADNPQILKDMEVMKPNYYGNKAKGTNSGATINRFGRSLFADWLLDTAHTPTEEVDENGEPVLKEIPNLYTVRSVGLINEAIAWNIHGNFDRISAIGMLMILREDRAKLEVNLSKEHTDSITGHKFWDSHFGTPTKKLF
jgi:hypothetical protein